MFFRPDCGYAGVHKAGTLDNVGDLKKQSGIIGGMFGLEGGAFSSTRPLLTALGPRSLLLATARSAFFLLVRQLSPPQVWLPSYLCGVVADAVSAAGGTVRFFPINERLEIADLAWVNEVRQGDLVVFIDYFGIRSWRSTATTARAKGAWVVEDASQALLLDEIAPEAHYAVFSPRKFVGVPEGGILLPQTDAPLGRDPLPPSPPAWWWDSFQASLLRAEFDRHGGDRRWFDLFRGSDPNGPHEPCAMSELTRVILHAHVDWQRHAEARRNNYRLLARRLPELALWPELPEDVVPLGFPIRLANRDPVRQHLFTREIYPPVHWPIAGLVPSEFHLSHTLAAELMTLPCDQRYSSADMNRLAETVCEAGARPVAR